MAEQGAWLVLKLRGNKQVEGALRSIGRGLTAMGSRAKAFGLASLNAFRGVGRALLNFKTLLISTLGVYAGFRIASRFIQETLAQQGRLEDSLRSITALLITQTGNYEKAVQGARYMVEGLGEDAKRLPGEFEDFLTIMRLMTGPMGAIGKSLDNIRELTGDIAMAASVFGENMEQAGEDSMRLLQGQALIRMELFRNLRSMNLIKETTEEWNKLTPVERYEKLRGALKALIGDQNIIRDTAEAWTTQTSTLHDNLFGIIGVQRKIGNHLKTVILPLIRRWNEWFEKNEEAVNRFAATVGTKIAGFFEVVGEKFLTMIEDMDKFRSMTDKVVYTLEGIIFVLSAIGGAATVVLPILKNGFLGIYAAALLAGQAVILLGEAMIETARQGERLIKEDARSIKYLVSVAQAGMRYLFDVVGYGTQLAGEYFKEAERAATDAFFAADASATIFSETLVELQNRSKMLGDEFETTMQKITPASEIIEDYQKLSDFFDEILRKLAQMRGGGELSAAVTAPEMNDYSERMEEATKTFTEKLEDFRTGIMAGIDKWLRTATDWMEQGFQAAMNVLDGFRDTAADAFADIAMGTKSAKEAMQDFFRSMIGMLVRTAAQLIITIILAAALEALLGDATAQGRMAAAAAYAQHAAGAIAASSAASSAGTPSQDSGGITNARGVYRTGAIQEAHVPIPSGRIPVEVRGGMGSMNQQFAINVSVNNPRDGNDVKRFVSSREFGRAVQAQINQQLASSPKTRGLAAQAARRAV